MGRNIHVTFQDWVSEITGLNRDFRTDWQLFESVLRTASLATH